MALENPFTNPFFGSPTETGYKDQILPSGRRMSVLYRPTLPLTTHMTYNFAQHALCIGNVAVANIIEARNGDKEAQKKVKSALKHEYQHAANDDAFTNNPQLQNELAEAFVNPYIKPYWDSFMSLILSKPDYRATLYRQGELNGRMLLEELFAFAAEYESSNVTNIVYGHDLVKAAGTFMIQLQRTNTQLFSDLQAAGMVLNKDFDKDYSTLRSIVDDTTTLVLLKRRGFSLR